MIPVRVQLQGFLSYKEEQEIDFAGASVWLLAGLNGSGKSSIFDAVTYALFGHHRGGGSDAVELINKECDKAQVTFEFTLEGRHYLIQKTLQRGKQGLRTSQQINGVNSAGTWEALSGTHLLKGFKEWIEQHIGLNYETFTSSVLLLQGRAEKLLDSTAKGRFEVLAGIVDLQRYERLHEHADETRKGLEGELKAGRARLAALEEVPPLALIEAESLIETAENARAAAATELDRARDWQRQAQEWAKLQERLRAAGQRFAQAEKTLADAAEIERKLQRLQEIQLLEPRLKDLVGERNRAVTAQRKLADLEKNRVQAVAEMKRLDDQQRLTREKLAALHKKAGDQEQMLQRTTEALHELQGVMTKLLEVERQEQERKALQEALKRLSADPEARVRETRDSLRQAQRMQQALAPLTRLAAQREELASAAPREQAAAVKLRQVQQRGEELRKEVDRLKPLLQEAQAARQRADQAAIRDGTLFEQARQLTDEFLGTSGAKLCRLCGQTLTASHWRQEKTRRQKELASAEEQVRLSSEALRQATAAEQTQRAQLESLEGELHLARDAYRDQLAVAKQAALDVQRCLAECASSYQELPAPLRERVAASLPSDWLATTYPAAADLAAARSEAAAVPAREQAAAEAQTQLDQWNRHQAQLTLVQEALARLEGGMPRDRAGIRQKHAGLAAEKKALESTAAALRREVRETAELIDHLQATRQRQQEALGKIQSEMAGCESEQQVGRQRVAQLRKELPATWHTLADSAGLAEVNQLREEKEQLVQEGVEEQAQQLQEARLHLDDRRREVAELTAEAEKVPAGARQPAEDLQRLVGQARTALETCDNQLLAARQHQQILEQKAEQRRQLEEQMRKLEQEATHAKLLADLLSRNRLQLHLVRQAERQVVDHANLVLDRLSGGQLYLRLAGSAGGEESDTKALELEVQNRHTGEQPINVAFLSGSQRFRVAVSLALGIGQYASRQHRPLESVIIDEGFGCLDRFGRQLMIQELQNLHGQVGCIILVSHQEEFADAFSDGYSFELVNGSTVATRFHRS